MDPAIAATLVAAGAGSVVGLVAAFVSFLGVRQMRASAREAASVSLWSVHQARLSAREAVEANLEAERNLEVWRDREARRQILELALKLADSQNERERQKVFMLLNSGIMRDEDLNVFASIADKLMQPDLSRVDPSVGDLGVRGGATS